MFLIAEKVRRCPPLPKWTMYLSCWSVIYLGRHNNNFIILFKFIAPPSRVINYSTFFMTGMMGSGKSTVGRILSEVLGYSFFDRFVPIFK